MLLVELKGPYRKLIVPPGYKKTYETCFLGSSLVFGVFIEIALTISCPGGCISTLCSDKSFDDLKTYNIKNVIAMAGTNNLFDKNNHPLMGPIEMYFLIEKLQFHNFKVSIIALISRRDKSAAKLIDCYRDVARDHRIPFAKHKKFRFRYVSPDGVHPNAKDIRELTSDFRNAITQNKIWYM